MIAIHHRPGSFSEKWIEYCEKHEIDFKIVNCYDSDIIDQMKDCDGLMWHWYHLDWDAQLFARQLIRSLEKMGKQVFPNSKTCWHYDDKVGQKYLLEAVDAPLVPSYVFYSKEDALQWIEETKFPKVFKTRNGAGSLNVRLIKNKREANKIIKKCFGKGISSYNKVNAFTDSLRKFKRDKDLRSIGRIVKHLLKMPLPASFQPHHSIERNYTYFQDFLPDNNFDIRVIIIGGRAFAIKRLVREDDFRASGSGEILYAKEEIPEELISMSFSLNSKLNTQSLALDYVWDKGQKRFLAVEIGYAFSQKGYLSCPGYWDSDLNWYEESFHPEYFMVEDFVNEMKVKY